MACEAEALAELKGDWTERGDPKALLVGNYLHSYFESQEAHREFINEHPEIIATSGKNKGHPKKEYQVADAMIATLKNDPKFQEFYQGDKEVIVTGKIGGIAWKGKLDCLPTNHKYFADLKTTQDIYKRFYLPDERRYGSFIEAYNYSLQMAVYQELVRQQYGVQAVPVIIAVSKQDPPDKAPVSIPQDLLDYWLERVKELQPHIEAVKNGEEEPKRCEHCDYCRATKHLTQIISLYDLIE